MKRIFAIPFLLVGMLLLTVSCNEELQIATYDQEAPSIASFTPTTGPVGTLVTVRGAGLHRIEKAYINDAEVEIRYAISGNEIVLRTTTAGSTGPISLEGPDGTARSAEIFTYTYPTPEITTYPESFTVGDEVVFFGTGLDGILNVRFDTVEGEIVDQRSTELVVKVPDLRIPEADITFSYFDGSSVVSFVHSGAEIVREVPKVDQLTPSGTVEVGTDVTATGSFLHLVEQIKVGDVEARIVSQPENGQCAADLGTGLRHADHPLPHALRGRTRGEGAHRQDQGRQLHERRLLGRPARRHRPREQRIRYARRLVECSQRRVRRLQGSVGIQPPPVGSGAHLRHRNGGHESRNSRARDVLPAQLGGGLLGRQGQHPQVRLHRDHAPGAGQERGERPPEQCNVQCLLAANPDG